MSFDRDCSRCGTDNDVKHVATNLEQRTMTFKCLNCGRQWTCLLAAEKPVLRVSGEAA